MDIRAKNYLQEVRELYLAAEQDEEVAQGYLLLAEKCKLKKYRKQGTRQIKVQQYTISESKL